MHKPGELAKFVWWLYKLFLWLPLLLLILVPGITSDEVAELLPPLPVKSMAHTETSVTLSWVLPNVSVEGIHVTGISIRYSSATEPEKVITIYPNNTSKMISDLKPDTDYTACVIAHYSNNVNVSTGKFVMSTLGSLNDYHYRDPMCDAIGTRQVEKLPSGGRCLCQIGYQGIECGVCSEGFYRLMERCKPCPCSKETSLGTCQIGSDEDTVACTCKQGYIGMVCDTCVNGYYPVSDYCISCHCLNCHEKTTSECEQCPEYRFNITDDEAVSRLCSITGPPHHRTVKHEDGTVAIVAVVISLAFIACVAFGITCYRNRLQAHNQVPFWSIELAEDKVSLNTGSDYQRLEGSSKQHFKSGHQRSSSVAEATVAKQRADQPQYNCISI